MEICPKCGKPVGWVPWFNKYLCKSCEAVFDRMQILEREPLRCEECAHFGDTDMGGEGVCKADGKVAWSECPACRRFEKINAGGGE